MADKPNKTTQSTAWARLQLAKAIEQERKNEITAGRLVWVEDVARTTRETWEMVGNDLRHTLPVMVADRLTGQGIDPAIIRQAVRLSVNLLVAGWKTEMNVEEGSPEKPNGHTQKNRKGSI